MITNFREIRNEFPKVQTVNFSDPKIFEQTMEKFLNDFYEFGLATTTNEELMQSDFLSPRDVTEISKCLTQIAYYFNMMHSKLGYVYETEDEAEYNLARICRIRSGLEFLLDFFKIPLVNLLEDDKFDNWYNVEAGIPNFDEFLRFKIKRLQVLSKHLLPNEIKEIEDHWWWYHPDQWIS